MKNYKNSAHLLGFIGSIGLRYSVACNILIRKEHISQAITTYLLSEISAAYFFFKRRKVLHTYLVFRSDGA